MSLPASDGEGQWYKKPVISECEATKGSKKSKTGKKTGVSLAADDIKKSIFHHMCTCKMCHDFDQAKISNSKSTAVKVGPILSLILGQRD